MDFTSAEVPETSIPLVSNHPTLMARLATPTSYLNPLYASQVLAMRIITPVEGARETSTKSITVRERRSMEDLAKRLSTRFWEKKIDSLFT